MLTDYHVHLETGPYTIDWLLEYVKVAKQRGIKELGFSEHGYRFKQTSSILSNPWIDERQTEDLDEYVMLIQAAKKQGLPVKLGLEMDYIPGKEKEIERILVNYPWDYVIGSVHWINDWGFDLNEMKEKWLGQSIAQVYGSYFNIIKELISSNLFDIIGHIDVIKVFGHRPEKEYSNHLNNIYDKLTNQLKTSSTTVEVSTAGLRKPVNELYPAPSILERISTANIPIILNSDAHRPEHVGKDFDKGRDYIKNYNINRISIFDERRRTMVPID